MNFKTWSNHIDESFKQSELDRILDKISDGKSLSNIEKKFLDNYGKSSDEDFMDFSHLSRDDTFEKIKSILSDKKQVICDLNDRDGKIGLPIISVFHNYENEKVYLVLNNKLRFELKDNYLYNMIYISNKDQYSLQSQDEYFELAPIKN